MIYKALVESGSQILLLTYVLPLLTSKLIKRLTGTGLLHVLLSLLQCSCMSKSS